MLYFGELVSYLFSLIPVEAELRANNIVKREIERERQWQTFEVACPNVYKFRRHVLCVHGNFEEQNKV
jgi:hypothetical protein